MLATGREKVHRILIVDDHALICDGVEALFASQVNLEVIGSAPNGEEALEIVAKNRPNLVVIDLEMPNGDGATTIAQLKQEFPRTKVLVLTFHSEDVHVYAALKAGADGYVLKDDGSAELFDAVRSVLNGKCYLSPSVCSRIVSTYLAGQSVPSAQQPVAALSKREHEVLKLIAEGYRTRDIATYLSISPKTVEKHRTNLMRKLDLHSVAAVTNYAISNGLVT